MLSVKEKVAYGLGDCASNIIWQTIMMFLLVYYTDVVGLAPAVVGTMFLLVRVIDAVTDPLMGAVADRTRTKYGQYRPYLVWLALPFGVISVLAFTAPEFSENGRLIYAFVTYTLLMMVYTAINIPYSALGGVLTADPKERVTVQTYRFIFAMLGGAFIAASTMPMVEYFGNGDNAKGYQYTMIVMSIMGVVMFLLCFAGTKERITTPVNQQSSFKEDFKSLWQNDQWRILCVAAVSLLTGQILRFSLSVYYVKYFLGREDLVSAFITLGMIGSIAGVALAQPLAKRVCKIKAYITLQTIAAIICAGSYFIGNEQVVLAFVVFFLWRFFLEMGTPLLWAKMADTIDYGHWKTGIRVTGIVYSSVVFFIKLGLALGGALAAWSLAYYGYQPDVEQSQATKDGILLSFTVLPAVGSIAVAIVMRWYILDDKKVEEIHQQLNHSTG
ncbi:MFS transporter [Thalassotalea sp. 42_200_T64]|nr:MFS transporter [Thalassotalea sp. 42_200_T64]